MIKSTGPKPVEIALSEQQQNILEEIVRCRHSPQYEVDRARIVLEASLGLRNRHIAQNLRLDRETVAVWRKRWADASEQMEQIESEQDFRKFVHSVLADAPRSGCPATFSPEEICQIIAVACELPEESQRPISEWTPRELTEEVLKRSIVPKISVRSVGRFLKSGRYSAAQISLLAQQ